MIDDPRSTKRQKDHVLDKRANSNNTAPRRDYQQYQREDNRDRTYPINWNKVEDITPGDNRLNFIAQVYKFIIVDYIN